MPADTVSPSAPATRIDSPPTITTRAQTTRTLTRRPTATPGTVLRSTPRPWRRQAASGHSNTTASTRAIDNGSYHPESSTSSARRVSRPRAEPPAAVAKRRASAIRARRSRGRNRVRADITITPWGAGLCTFRLRRSARPVGAPKVTGGPWAPGPSRTSSALATRSATTRLERVARWEDLRPHRGRDAGAAVLSRGRRWVPRHGILSGSW